MSNRFSTETKSEILKNYEIGNYTWGEICSLYITRFNNLLEI